MVRFSRNEVMMEPCDLFSILWFRFVLRRTLGRVLSEKQRGSMRKVLPNPYTSLKGFVFPPIGLLSLFLLLAGCGREELKPIHAQSPCDEPGEMVNAAALLTEDCPRLSQYRLLSVHDGKLKFAERNIPYDVNNELFSDYAYKYRSIWVPPGTTITWNSEGILELPVGSVITKTFTYPFDFRNPEGGEHFLETRLLIHRTTGWVARTYIWDAVTQDATLRRSGAFLETEWVNLEGKKIAHKYFVPDLKQCKGCHSETENAVTPIGIKARQMNRFYLYPDGVTRNQLQYLAELGMLSGLPSDPDAIPHLPPWEDLGNSLEKRARSYLEANCAHCHNPRGPAKSSGLYLYASVTNPVQYGVCKPPVAAGRGAGPGRRYNIVPGNPDASILVFRMESLDPTIMMPEIGRRLSHWEAIEVIRQWIAEMSGSCP